MTAITPFEFPATGERVRTVMWNGAPGFVGKDVCNVLQHTNHRVALARLPERMKGVTEVDTPGGPQQMTVITEPGVYRLVMRSSLPAAEAFQDWIAEEVVPAIRRTGSYNVIEAYQVPRTLPEALRAYATEVEAHEHTRAALTEAAPKAESWDVLAEAKGDYALREAAQILDRDPHISTGQNRLARYLRHIGWTDSSGQPYQAQVDNGRLARRANYFTDRKTGEERSTSQLRITVKGLKELRRRMLSGQQQLVVIEGGA